MEEHENNPLPMAEAIGSGFLDLEMDEHGSIVFSLSEEAEDINPEFYAVCKMAMMMELMEFAKLGYIDWRFDDNLNLEYRYTQTGLDYLKSKGIPPN